MQTILIATGDPRRGDAAVAHRVLELLGSQPNVEMQTVVHLESALAAQIAPADEIVFIDAARELGDPWVESAPPTQDTNPTDPRGLIALSRALFQFQGRAYVIHVPGLDFSEGAPLTDYAEARARQAVDILRRFLAA